MSSGNEPGSWGKDAVLRWVSAPGLVCEVLETEPACEQTRSTFLTHAAGRQLCEGWRLAFLRSLFISYTIYFTLYK